MFLMKSKNFKKHIFWMGCLFALQGCIGMGNKPNKPSTVPQFKTTLQTSRVWVTKVDSGTSKYYLHLTPAISLQKIFIGSYNGKITALNQLSGAVLWQKKIGGHITGGLSVNNNKLFVAAENGTITALSQTNGQKLWETQLENKIFSSPAVSNNIIVIKEKDGTLCGLSEETGKINWTYRQNALAMSLSKPTIKNNLVIAGFTNDRLVALNLQNGLPFWTKKISAPASRIKTRKIPFIDIVSIIKGNTVYAITYQGNIAALDLSSGRFRWRHKITEGKGMTADADKLYTSDTSGHVWSLTQSFGIPNWRQTKLSGRIITAPARDGKYIVVGDAGGYLYWINKHNGKLIGRAFTDSSGIFANPAIADGIVYIYTRNGNLYAFNSV